MSDNTTSYSKYMQFVSRLTKRSSIVDQDESPERCPMCHGTGYVYQGRDSREPLPCPRCSAPIEDYETGFE